MERKKSGSGVFGNLSPNDQWIDISATIRTGMPNWPSDPPVRITRIYDIKEGDDSTISILTMGSHTGTHMDAPLHFLKEGKGLETMPFAATIGPARVIEIRDRESIKPDELGPYQIKPGERVLFKTINSSNLWENEAFAENFVALSLEGALHLVAAGVRTVGIDYLSIGGYQSDGRKIHQVLLKAGVWIIEGLNLSSISPGDYDLICLPLKIFHSDGAPARAILRARKPS